MARIRSVKPEFFTSEQIADCSPSARLLFIGIWVFSDDQGVHPASVKTLKMEIFPSDEILLKDISEWMEELKCNGLIGEYESSGKPYWYVTGWHHQKIDKPTKKHPEPPIISRSPRVPIPDISPSPLVSLPDNSGTERKGEERISKPPSPAGEWLACPAEEIVSLYHECMPSNPRCKILNPARRAAIKARWLEASRLTCKPFGYTTREGGLAAWRSFFETCAESVFLTGRAQPQPGKPPFMADIDFLMLPSKFAKCLENFYHREAA